MNRRQFLAGSATLGILLSGCLNGESPVEGQEPTDTANTSPAPTANNAETSDTPPTDTTEKEPGRRVYDEYESEDVIESVTVGQPGSDNNGPHTIHLWNGADNERQFDLKLTDKEAGEAVYDESLEIRADGWFEVTIHRVSSYRFQFRVPEVDDDGTLAISTEQFDCNSSNYFIGVFKDGDVGSMEMSTAMGCRTVTTTSNTESES